MLWTVLRSAVLLIAKIVMFPVKAINVALAVIWLPFYILSQALSLLTNVLYVIFLVYILQRLFGWQTPFSLAPTDIVREGFNWFFPGYVMVPTTGPGPAASDVLAGRNMQQIVDMLKKSKT